MRWFAPIVIVALVAAGASGANASRTHQRSSISATTNATRASALRSANGAATKVVPRRGLAGRTAVSDRRSDNDEVYIVPRSVSFLAMRAVEVLERHIVVPPRSPPARIIEVARGPPSVVVPSHPVF